MDICWSSDAVLDKLEGTDYDIVVANVAMAESRNFFLLRQNLLLNPWVPFVVTARAMDHDMAARALDLGASDIIVAPLVPSEAVSAVQAAYKFHELRMTIALDSTGSSFYSTSRLFNVRTNCLQP